MQHKKIIAGAVALALVVGGTFAYYSNGELLQGRFGSKSAIKTKPSIVSSTSSGSSSESAVAISPDFYFDGDISYNSSLNYFQVEVCQTNVKAADVKQTSLKYKVAGGQQVTVEFTPTVTTAESCQTVYSRDLASGLLITQSGDYDITATLDTTSVHTEASESNNTLTTSDVETESDYYLYDSSNLPDLTVGGMDFVIDENSDGSKDYSVSTTICGLDEYLAYPSGSLVVSYTVTQGGTVLDSGESTLRSPASTSGSCKDFSIDLDASVADSLSTGTVSMNTQVDVMEATPESDENNNGFFDTFTESVVVE